MSSIVLLNNRAKASIGTLDWAVNERQLCDIVFVDHAQDGSLFDSMDLWVLKLCLVDRRLLIETIGRYKLSRVMFGQAMKSIQWLWKTGGCQAVYRCLKWPPL